MVYCMSVLQLQSAAAAAAQGLRLALAAAASRASSSCCRSASRRLAARCRPCLALCRCRSALVPLPCESGVTYRRQVCAQHGTEIDADGGGRDCDQSIHTQSSQDIRTHTSSTHQQTLRHSVNEEWLVLTSSEAEARLAAGVDTEAVSSSAPAELLSAALALAKRPAPCCMAGRVSPLAAATAAPAAPFTVVRASAGGPSAAPLPPCSDPALLPAVPSVGCRGVDGCGGDNSTASPGASAPGLPAPAVSVAVSATLVTLAVGLVMALGVGSNGNRGVCTAASARQAPSKGAGIAEAAAASFVTAAGGPAASSDRMAAS